MKALIFFICLIWSGSTWSDNFKIVKIMEGLKSPWSLTFVDGSNILITQKSGELLYGNIKNKTTNIIKHNLSITEQGQGGLLDVLYKDKMVYISYSEIRSGGKSSTSIAIGKFNKRNIFFKNIFRANPPIASGYHFGSRIIIKGDYLFASLGERGRGQIAQDPTKHPGSIIRIKLNGEIPEDNPRFVNKMNWLPELFLIGVRNPQGMYLSPFDNEVYISNHGARGGDWFGRAVKSGNYGWNLLGWGGVNYDGSIIGPKWKPGFTKPLHYWVPSIAVSSIVIYQGKEFSEWDGQALITSLKDKSLRRLIFNKELVMEEKIIFRGNIGRIRDIKVEGQTGKIFLLTDNGGLWRLEKLN